MEQWEPLKNVDIRTVDRKDLIDITKVNKEDPLNEDADRIKHFWETVKNPYCFLVGDVVVKSTFIGSVSLKQRILELLDG